MLNIVIIDDEKAMLDIIATLLEDRNMKCHLFESGKEALRFILQNNIDVAIIDLSMPEINGIEIISKIRNFSKDLPIIAMSGMDWKETLLQGALITGANKTLKKPFDSQTLYSTIKSILNVSK